MFVIRLTLIASFYTGQTAQAFRTKHTSRMHLRGENITKYVRPAKRNSNSPLKVKGGLMARFRIAAVYVAHGRWLRVQRRPRVGPLRGLDTNSLSRLAFLVQPRTSGSCGDLQFN